MDAMKARREHAELIAGTIAAWSQVEAQMGIVLASMLHTKSGPFVIMYSAIESQTAQFAVLDATAKDTLSKGDADLFCASTIAIRRASSHRNKFAHRIWGITNKFPESILLAKSNVLWNFQAQFSAELMLNSPADTNFPKTDFSEIYAYKIQDLLEAREATIRAHLIAHDLSILVGPIKHARELARTRLESEPEIRSILDKARDFGLLLPEALLRLPDRDDVY
ncbi:hypothetical protein [Siccirubricoccus sp. G192]|uniref:hypothetical protein n=1 Tax=Siccirubricoccus sp. G192 TaxID=2849651 RepID=UPI001C2B7F45|nr:hypothetical protein [Siccirubricoccus sp. G192]MBV1799727.1 hypothetical protein [Siccirubricoccus sp. G192]